jgi:hypothetical protein
MKMQIYEVLKYFDRTRYYVAANSEQEMLDMVDAEFVKQLNTATDLVDDYDEENGERQYDDLRNSREDRMREISYTLLIDDARKPTIVEHNLKGDLHKFYF